MNMELLNEIIDVLENNQGSKMVAAALSGEPFLLDRCDNQKELEEIVNTYNSNMVFSEVIEDNYVLAIGTYKNEIGKFYIDKGRIAGSELFPKSEYMPSVFVIGNGNLQSAPHLMKNEYNLRKSNKEACEQFGIAPLIIWDNYQIINLSECKAILSKHYSEASVAAMNGQPFILCSFGCDDDMINELASMMKYVKWMTEEWSDNENTYHLTLLTLKNRDFTGRSVLDNDENILYTLIEK